MRPHACVAAALAATPPPLERRDVPHGGRPQAVACTAESDGPARLAGETESEYAHRQARLEAAARERMSEKFGGAPLPAAAGSA